DGDDGDDGDNDGGNPGNVNQHGNGGDMAGGTAVSGQLPVASPLGREPMGSSPLAENGDRLRGGID
ncbi:MAG: hypothetical protein HKN78_12435, partial [Sphingomonadaceae bacterium]|nr:hypothetical protein [Sphingomonadaceae bacterium]